MHRIVSSLAAAGLAAFVATGSFAQGGGGGGAGGSGGGGSGAGQGVGSQTGGTGTGGEMGRGQTGGMGGSESGRGAAGTAPVGAGQQEQTLTVVTVQEDAKQIVARPASGGQKTVVLTDATRIERHGQQGGGMLGGTLDLGDIEPGDRIMVMGSTQGDRLNAQRIQVLAKGAAERDQ